MNIGKGSKQTVPSSMRASRSIAGQTPAPELRYQENGKDKSGEVRSQPLCTAAAAAAVAVERKPGGCG